MVYKYIAPPLRCSIGYWNVALFICFGVLLRRKGRPIVVLDEYNTQLPLPSIHECIHRLKRIGIYNWRLY